MKLSEFDFDLPGNLIAERPAEPRDSARLLHAGEGGALSDLRVRDLPGLLRAGDCLVFNDTRVIPARLAGVMQSADGSFTGARIELNLLSREGGGVWQVLAKGLRRVREGRRIRFSEGFWCEALRKEGGRLFARFNLEGESFEAALRACGQMPLPPYILKMRGADERDFSDYQTMFARRSGAVAAPTASLHFDEGLLARARSRGVGVAFVTLHVGGGTFLPVKAENVDDHKMHSEWGEVPAGTAEAVNAARKAGGRAIAVGTTVLRLLETAASGGGLVKEWRGETDIFIRPGHRFRAVDALMTNFHLPKSTLLMLVSAFIGMEGTRRLYSHAVSRGYRFFSYGDACFLEPGFKSDT